MEKLNTTFFYNLEKTVKTYRQFFQSQLRKNGFEITLDQWLMLHTILEYPEASQNEIAERVFKDKASVTRIIELLVQNGYLTREIHPTNRRKFQLGITDKGKQTIEVLKDLVVQFRSTALAGIPVEKIEETQALLNTIVNNCNL